MAAIYNAKNKKGKLVVVGSVEMFMDEYFDKEENSKLFVYFFIAFFFY